MKVLRSLFSSLLWCLPFAALAQQPGAPAEAQVSAATGDISGIVTDSEGGLVQDASVLLTSVQTHQQRATSTTSDGRFRFSDISPGAFTIAVSASGLAPVSRPLTLQPQQLLELPPLSMRVAMADSNVQVTLTQQEMAEEDLHVAEKQRLGGFVPNFYVVYDWKAPPLTTRQKFKLADRAVIDPANFVIIAGIAGIEQATNGFSGYGQGAAGYGKRVGAGMADLTIGAYLGGAILPALFRQDPRYFYKGTGTVRARTFYALSTAVIARGDNGRWQPAYAAVLGDFASGAISNIYYPASNRTGAGLTVQNGLIGIGFNGVGNLIQEFLLRKLTPGSKSPRPAIPEDKE